MKKKIIVIDDSETIRDQVAIALAENGFELVHAEDGAQGAAAIRNHPDAVLAICDVNMPKMSGIEMLELLQAQSVAKPPVLMLTTEGRPDLIDRARASGARGWIVKPFKPDLLRATVKKIVGVAA